MVGGTTYYYIVTASNLIGESAASTHVGTTPLPTPISAEEMSAPSFSTSVGTASLISATTVVGRLYQLQHCDDLADEWENHGPAKHGTGGPLEFLIPILPAEDRHFYRILILQP